MQYKVTGVPDHEIRTAHRSRPCRQDPGAAGQTTHRRQATVLGRYWNLSGASAGAAFTIEGALANQLAVGLSFGNGKVLTVFGTDFFSSSADLCARFIMRPFVQSPRIVPQGIEMTFNGILQSSTNLETWIDYTPQPSSPSTNRIGRGNQFFRACAETTPSPSPIK